MLAKMLPKFSERGLFNLSKFQCKLNVVDDIEKQLIDSFIENDAKYHKSCYTTYDQCHFDQLSRKQDKSKSDLDNTGPSSSKRPKRETLDLGELKCFICEKPDVIKNLCAAGTMHAKNISVKKQHVKDLTENIKKMASVLDNQIILSKFSCGDVASNELNYHKSCYIGFKNQYNSKIRKENKKQDSLKYELDDFWKVVCFNKIVTYVKETYITGIDFEANSLMKLYENLLRKQNVLFTPQLTRFTDDLMRAIPQLERRGVTKQKVKLYFNIDVDNLIKDTMSTNSFVEQLNKIVVVIRKKISETKNKFTGSFSVNCQKESVPKELLI